MRSDTKFAGRTPTLCTRRTVAAGRSTQSPPHQRGWSIRPVKRTWYERKMPRPGPLETRNTADIAASRKASAASRRADRRRGHGNVCCMPTGNGSEPTVIVDDLHVVYRVYGAGGDKGTAATALMRVVKRQRRPSVREVHAVRGVSFVANHGDAVGDHRPERVGQVHPPAGHRGAAPAERGCVYTSGQAALLGVNAALLDDLTGERNVVLGCLAMGMSRRKSRTRYQSIVDFSGSVTSSTTRCARTPPGWPSGCALIASPRAMNLDDRRGAATGDANSGPRATRRSWSSRRGGDGVPRHAQPGRDRGQLNRVIWLEKGEVVMQGRRAGHRRRLHGGDRRGAPPPGPPPRKPTTCLA